MKSLLTAALLASSVFAATSASAEYLLAPNATAEESDWYNLHHARTGQYHVGKAASEAYARVDRPDTGRAGRSKSAVHSHSTNPQHDVHVGGRYIGSDPDLNVRQSLAREVYSPIR